MIHLDIKPLSLNSAYRGRRFATDELKDYKRAISLFLPAKRVLDGKLLFTARFGVSSKRADGDNLIKCLQDAVSEKYGFNDNQIYRWEVEKVDVVKGKEFIEFDLSPFLLALHPRQE